MDLLDATRKERAAVLDYSDAQALVSYYNYLRERQGLVSLTPETDIAGTLGILYPQVVFKSDKSDRYKIRAEMRSEVEGSLIDQIGLVTSQTDFLETKISQNYDALQVIFRADGLGIIKEDSWFEFFDHNLNLDEVRQECEGDADAIDDHLSQYFFDEVSEMLEDPFFDPDGSDCPIEFDCGSEEELERLMKLFILTEPAIETRDGEEVRLYAALEDEEPYLDSEGCYCTQRLEALTEIALAENRPVGWTWEYNDGAYNRRSGYSQSPECFTWQIGDVLEEASARERMAARRELRLYLEKRGHTLAEFDALAEVEKAA
jgi:hypothetical protein